LLRAADTTEEVVLPVRMVSVRVTTGSGNPRVEEEPGGSYLVYVSASPERGKANAELLKAISRHLGVPKGSISIVRGRTSREKMLRIDSD
jgi:uncharacterized protein YggU (UPF0235/DUF167 family)